MAQSQSVCLIVYAALPESCPIKLIAVVTKVVTVAEADADIPEIAAEIAGAIYGAATATD